MGKRTDEKKKKEKEKERKESFFLLSAESLSIGAIVAIVNGRGV